MHAEVVCISRTVEAKGERIGQMVADRLGFRYVDEQIVVRAAQLAQVDPQLVAAAEHRQPLLERLIEKLTPATELVGPAALAAGLPIDIFAPAPVGYRASPDEMRTLIRAAIHELAKAGRMVMVAHAASMALAFVGGVLRVLVTASVETRARRLAAARGLSATDAAAAIAKSDRERRDYFRDFYQLKEELPTCYDLVLNTDVLSPELATDIVVHAAQGHA